MRAMVGDIEALPDGAAVVHVGAEWFISPSTTFWATPSQLARLEVALVLGDVDGLGGARRDLLAEIEREMAREARRRARLPEGRAVRTGPDLAIEEGPVALVPGCMLGLPVIETEQGRVYSPDPHRPGYDANKAPVMEKFDRLAPEQLEPVQIRRGQLDATQRRELREADQKLRSRSRADRVEGRAQGEAVQRQLLARRQAAEVSRGLRETVTLEIAREELDLRESLAAEGYTPRQIEERIKDHRDDLKADPPEILVRDQRGGFRIAPRDGLASLLASGAIDGAEHAAGEKYGRIFEKARPKLRIANLSGTGGGSTMDANAEREQRLRELAAKQALTDIEAYVQTSVKSPRALTALRLVAGEGRCVSHFSKGASRAKNVQALQLALEALAIRWGLK